MPDTPKIALIPAYEPSELLIRLAERLDEAGFEIVAVDDGSAAGCSGIFDTVERFAAVLTHTANRGKGCALKTGLAYIRSHFPEDSIIVTLDADGQHKIEDALRVCASAAENGGALTLGCRHFDRGVPARSRFGNTVTRFVYRLTTGCRVSDTQTGLRAFGAGLIPFMLEVNGERYEYEMNVLLACARHSIPIRELEIETVYFDNNSASHFSTFRDSYRVYRDIIKYTVSSLTHFGRRL